MMSLCDLGSGVEEEVSGCFNWNLGGRPRVLVFKAPWRILMCS